MGRFGVTIVCLAEEYPLHAPGTAPRETFGRLRVLHQIGAGALGPVFRAYDPELERLVAVKLFEIDLPPERVHQLVAEFERLIAVQLSHPGIAAPVATGIDGVLAYLAQQYVSADSLDVVVRQRGPIPVAEAVSAATQLAGALDSAALVGVVHGALHPRDILLGKGEARVTGIGVARALEIVGCAIPVHRPFTAPERLGGGAWDRRADIFSLAALVREMIRIRQPGVSDAESADAPAGLPGGDPQAVRDVFARALAERPEDRFDTALAFARALSGAYPAGRRASRSARRTREEELPLPLEAFPGETEPAAAPAGSEHVAPALEPSQACAPALITPIAEDAEVQVTAAPAAVEPPVPEVAPAPPPAPLVETPAAPEAPLPEVAPVLELRSPEIPGVELPAVDLKPVELSGLDVSGVALSRRVSEPARVTPKPADEPAAAGHSRARESPRQMEGREAIEPREPEATAQVVPVIGARPTVPSTAEIRAGSVAPVEPEPAIVRRERSRVGTVSERSRSALWPIAGAMLIGAALGFAAGYLVGSREPSSQVVAPQSPPAEAKTAPVPEGARSAEPSSKPPVSIPAPGPGVPDGRAGATAAAGRGQAAAPSGLEAGASPSAPKKGLGRLVLRSRPAGARAFVDGRERGRTPLNLQDLAFGTHTVRFARTGYSPLDRTVAITASNPVRSITVTLAREVQPPAPQRVASSAPPGPGALLVDSLPPGAAVFLDEKLVGSTPLLVPEMTSGEHSLRLQLDGYRSWSSPVRIVPGERGKVTASLER
jgi:hypothetical protein